MSRMKKFKLKQRPVSVLLICTAPLLEENANFDVFLDIWVLKDFTLYTELQRLLATCDLFLTLPELYLPFMASYCQRMTRGA